MDRMLVNKWEMQTSDTDRFHLKKLNDTKIFKKYLVIISNWYACLQGFDDCGDIGTELKNTSHRHAPATANSSRIKFSCTKNVKNLKIKRN